MRLAALPPGLITNLGKLITQAVPALDKSLSALSQALHILQ